MDQAKLAYFVDKYRSADLADFEAVRLKVGELADEAAAAVRQVASERGRPVPVEDSLESESKEAELTPDKRAVETRLSSELWHGPWSKLVRFQFALLLGLPVLNLLTKGLDLGVFFLLVTVIPAGALGDRVGRSIARSICANADKSISEKRKSLVVLSMVLWPAIILATVIALQLAKSLSGGA